jgi:hypothetical protein
VQQSLEGIVLRRLLKSLGGVLRHRVDRLCGLSMIYTNLEWIWWY